MTTSSDSDDRPPARSACSITFLHGVGLDPTLVADVVDELRARRPDVAVHVPLRRGYRGDEPASSFDELVDDVAALVAPTAPTVLVGVSGGATLAVAAAVRAVPGVVAAVAHEPLVGPAAPELHAIVQASAAMLAADEVDGAVEDPTTRAGAFVARLVGADVWASLPHGAHAFTAAHSATVHAEVPSFVGFAPTPGELASLRMPLVVSTGEHSPPARHAAAAVLVAAGATSRVIDRAGHLAVWQRPTAFAELVLDVWHTATDALRSEDAA